MPLDYTLYLATDRNLLQGRNLEDTVAIAIRHGVTLVQMREKSLSSREFYEAGRRLLQITRRCGVPLIINDRLDLMLALDADGVHLGRHDLPLPEARRLCPGKILGYSVNSAADLQYAEQHGADYAGLGPVFPTPTKADTDPALGLAGLADLVKKARIPCVAIGGINVTNAAAVTATGVAGICVISAILSQPDTAAATWELRQALSI